MSNVIEKIKEKQKTNDRTRKIVELFVPLSFIFFFLMYIGALRASIIIAFNEMIGYISYDMSQVHTIGNAVEYGLTDMLGYIPASQVMVYVPILTVLGVVATLYLSSLFLRKDVKQKAVFFSLSTLIMCAINFFMIIFIVGTRDFLTKLVLVATVADLLIIANRVRVAFLVKKS